ncbi:MAG: RIP metalloprotease RseP [Rhodospirillaceae bacterium]|nr:RIP metalloprotease RseP [Rhodospirillaceae bacterium]
MSFLSGLPHYAVSFLVVLTVLVFFHELGHFWVARRNGVRVETFSIGFGPELFGFTDRLGTRWKFSLLPLGGYVKMFGEADTLLTPDGQERVLTAAERAVSFAQKRVGQRAAIVLAGPLANFVLAIVLLGGLFAIYGKPYLANIVGEVQPGTAAEAAGIRPGDRIVEVNGQHVDRFEDIAVIVRLGLDAPLDLVIERDGREIRLTAHPTVQEDIDVFGNKQRIGLLGIRPAGESGVIRYDPASAVWEAAQETWRMTAGTLTALGQIVSGTRPAEELGGVLRIAKASGDVASAGLAALVSFAALLSVNLGLINLFPIPMLDGGHLAFYAIEAARGRPLGPRAQEWGFRIGLALVLSLMVFATWNDLVSLKVLAYLKNLVT